MWDFFDTEMPQSLIKLSFIKAYLHLFYCIGVISALTLHREI